MIRLLFLLIVLTNYLLLNAKEYHVGKNGSDKNTGSIKYPFLTIQAAANVAQPGDVIIVHKGIYRERVNPPRGGAADYSRIIYEGAKGEEVIIKGSEVIKDWKKVKDDVWQVSLNNTYFGGFNPYSDTINGHWFDPKGRKHHTGAVYLNGNWLPEAASKDDILNPAGKNPMWFGEVDDNYTILFAQFPGVDPNKEEVEINVRQTVFFPDKSGLNYITVRGFTMCHAATPWAPPTTVQPGLIGPHWSKGWIIENNKISHSRCVGISLGLANFDKKVAGNAPGFTELVKYLINEGHWSRDKVGSHIIRGNSISFCEQAGIAGSLGAAFSLIEGNHIFEIHTQRNFGGQEQGGIKLHGAIDVCIKGNLVRETGPGARGIWLDWLGQGATISDNLAFNNETCDLYLEVNHGPILVVNNFFLSKRPLVNLSRGTAFVHNYFGGPLTLSQTTRITPYAEAHSTILAGMHGNAPGDDRFYNNIFTGEGPVIIAGWGGIDSAIIENLCAKMEGNLYTNETVPHKNENNPVYCSSKINKSEIVRRKDGYYINWNFGSVCPEVMSTKLITSDVLGKAKVPDMKFENPDGSPFIIDTDLLGAERNKVNPLPGPLEIRRTKAKYLKLWPQ